MKTINNSFSPINILLVIIMLSSPCLLINYILIVFGFNATIFRYFLLATTLFVTFIVFRRCHFTIFQKKIQIYFFVIIIYFLIIWNIDILFSGSPRNVFRIVLLSPFLMIIMNDRRFRIYQFIRLFLFISFVFASLSILQYIVLPLGLIPVRSASFVRSSLDGAYVGIGGVYTVVQETGFYGISYRNQGFFSEPTNFAQFLMVPMFISLQKLLNKKNWRNILYFLSIAIAFFLTFSVANYFGVFTGFVLFYYIRTRSRKYYKKGHISKIGNAILTVFVVYLAFSFFQMTDVKSDSDVLAKNTMGGLGYKYDRNLVYFDRIIKYPFGDIQFKNEYTASTGLIGHIALAGGFPFLLMMILFFAYYFRTLLKWMPNSKYLLIYIGLFAYFIPVLWDAKFYEHYFLFILVFFATFIKNDQMGYEIIR